MKEKPEETPLRVFSAGLERISQDARHWAEDSNGRGMHGPYLIDTYTIRYFLKSFFGETDFLSYWSLNELGRELAVRLHSLCVFSAHAHSLVAFEKS